MAPGFPPPVSLPVAGERDSAHSLSSTSPWPSIPRSCRRFRDLVLPPVSRRRARIISLQVNQDPDTSGADPVRLHTHASYGHIPLHTLAGHLASSYLVTPYYGHCVE